MKIHYCIKEFHGKFLCDGKKKKLLSDVTDALKRSRVIALVGPRQCGKTTIAREFVPIESFIQAVAFKDIINIFLKAH